MTISYNWLSEYLPVRVEPERLSEILTSIGLEVESMKRYESVLGGLRGVVVGEIVACEKHPNADKLKVTKVSTGDATPLQIVCGAPNAAVGQKVLVAPVGTTIYPLNGHPLTMKVATIRNVESHGMICAEDELGIGNNHDGIIVLPDKLQAGTPAAEYFKPYEDIIYEIGLTPNRMDAMSHLGVAKDICAYLTHHDKHPLNANIPFNRAFYPDHTGLTIDVSIENRDACQRYAGVSITGVTVQGSPKWLSDRLQAIGLRPVNNIVDITNYVLHETGQPLHAFDADTLTGRKLIVKKLPEGTSFVTLDEKERKLSSGDLMICNAEEAVCIAGVFGGVGSGVKDTTSNVFLESAWFNPADIRRTSFRHNLRTDAATRFEKGVDISNTVNVLKRAALLIKEIAGGEIASAITDSYPAPKPKTEVVLNLAYLKKLSGKDYSMSAVKNILEALGFETVEEGMETIRLKVPYSKPDILLPADIAEEILRIDGYDNIAIPSAITITPSIEIHHKARLKEKISSYLAGLGFNEILTNSITNSAYFSNEVLSTAVKMINSLSADLNIMRPSMIESGLQAVSYNLNRRNTNLQLFEFGKTYAGKAIGNCEERNHLCLYVSGNRSNDAWKGKGAVADFYFLKGVVNAILQLLGIPLSDYIQIQTDYFDYGLKLILNDTPALELGRIEQNVLKKFDIRQPVFVADFSWDVLMQTISGVNIKFAELPKQLPVHRDLAIIVPKDLTYDTIEKTVHRTKLQKLKSMQLFDIFESDKLGAGKKSMAISFTFLDEEKTLNDQEIDGMMKRIMMSFENELKAEIRK